MPVGHQSFDGLGAENNLPKTGWSAADKMFTGNADRTVNLQATFSEPGPYTVQFGMGIIPGQNVLVANVAFKARATIIWTVEGNEISRIVDIGNGVSVSGTGQAVRVVVRDFTDTLPADVGFEYVVSVQVAKGTRPDTGQPPTLSAFDRIDPVNLVIKQSLPPLSISAPIPIPDGAGIISVMVTIASSGASEGMSIPEQAVVVRQSTGGIVLKSYDPRSGLFIPITPGVQELTVSNLSATLDMVFNVTFGIDG